MICDIIDKNDVAPLKSSYRVLDTKQNLSRTKHMCQKEIRFIQPCCFWLIRITNWNEILFLTWLFIIILWSCSEADVLQLHDINQTNDIFFGKTSFFYCWYSLEQYRNSLKKFYFSIITFLVNILDLRSFLFKRSVQ